MRVWSGQAGESPGRALLAGNGEAPWGGEGTALRPAEPVGKRARSAPAACRHARGVGAVEQQGQCSLLERTG